MNRWIALLLTGVSLVMLVPGVIMLNAQEDTPECSLPQMQVFLDVMIGSLEDARALDDAAAVRAKIRDVRNAAASMDRTCAGLLIEGSGVVDKVYDPIWISAGIYRVRLLSVGSAPITVQFTTTEGRCEARYVGSTDLFVEAQSGAQTLILSRGCAAIFSVFGANAPYQVDFERMD